MKENEEEDARVYILNERKRQSGDDLIVGIFLCLSTQDNAAHSSSPFIYKDIAAGSVLTHPRITDDKRTLQS